MMLLARYALFFAAPHAALYAIRCRVIGAPLIFAAELFFIAVYAIEPPLMMRHVTPLRR